MWDGKEIWVATTMDTGTEMEIAMQSFACDRWGCGTDLSEAAALGKGGLAEVVFADALKLWEGSLTHHNCRHWILADACKT